jgi:hypothetical protein
MDDLEFKMKLVQTITEVATDQKNLIKKLDDHIVEVEKLSGVVYGNGKVGLVGKVDNIMGKYAAIAILSTLLAGAVLNAAATRYIAPVVVTTTSK